MTAPKGDDAIRASRRLSAYSVMPLRGKGSFESVRNRYPNSRQLSHYSGDWGLGESTTALCWSPVVAGVPSVEMAVIRSYSHNNPIGLNPAWLEVLEIGEVELRQLRDLYHTIGEIVMALSREEASNGTGE